MITMLSDVVFYYTTIAGIRVEGVPLPSATPPGPTDARIQLSILRNSQLINKVTAQWFQPVSHKVIINGSGGKHIYHPYILPIIEMNAIASVDVDDVETPIDSIAWAVDGRFVSKRQVDDPILYPTERRAVWRHGVKNYSLDGVFGHIQIRQKLEKTLTAAVTYGDTAITVSDVTGLRAGDSVLIGGQHFFINVVTAPNTLEIDPALVDVAIPATVIRYGQVPLDIVWAMNMLVIGDLNLLGSDDTIEDDIQGRIKSETVDNYKYTLGRTLNDEEQASYRIYGTGNAKVDSILGRYLPPHVIKWV